jgi:hypothetical protein
MAFANDVSRAPHNRPARARVARLLACLILPLALLIGPDGSAQTRTQGIEGNPNCPQPVINGIRPKNWSCPTGTQGSPRQQESTILQGSVSENEIQDGDAFLRGASNGFAACADGLRHALGSTLVAAVQFLSFDFVGMEETLGLERGRGVIQRLITHELSQPAVNATSEEAGERIARRICQYVLIPEAASAARVGGTPFNPVRAQEINANWKGLQGKWVEIGDRGEVIQLGLRRGKGSYGAVYEDAATAGQVIKVMNGETDMAAAVTGQVQGMFRVMQDPAIPVPKIWNYRLGANGGPAYIVMEDISKIYPNLRPKWFSSANGMSAADLEATRLLHQQLGEQGLIWADANVGNLFTVTLEDGSTIAGIADADKNFPAAELGQQSVYRQQFVRALNEPLEPMANPFVPAQEPNWRVLLSDPSGIDASAIMERMYHTRRAYGQYGPQP